MSLTDIVSIITNVVMLIIVICLSIIVFKTYKLAYKQAITEMSNNKENEEQQDNKDTTENIDYDNMSVLELREIARKHRIKNYYNLKKVDLIKTLKEL